MIEIKMKNNIKLNLKNIKLNLEYHLIVLPPFVVEPLHLGHQFALDVDGRDKGWRWCGIRFSGYTREGGKDDGYE